MVEDEERDEAAVLHERHAQQRLRIDGRKRGDTVGGGGARVPADVGDDDGPAGAQVGNQRRAESFQAVPADDAADAVGVVAGDEHVRLGRVDLAVRAARHLEVAAGERGGLAHDVIGIADGPRYVVDGQQEALGGFRLRAWCRHTPERQHSGIGSAAWPLELSCERYVALPMMRTTSASSSSGRHGLVTK